MNSGYSSRYLPATPLDSACGLGNRHRFISGAGATGCDVNFLKKYFGWVNALGNEAGILFRFPQLLHSALACFFAHLVAQYSSVALKFQSEFAILFPVVHFCLSFVHDYVCL
jgi:hypothetical protein